MAKKKKRKPKVKTKSSMKAKLFLSLSILMAMIFLPSTLLLSVGMIPTFVAIFVVKKSKKNKAITIGAANLAGCSYYLMELWTQEHTVEQTINIIANPLSIIVMFSAAAVGYLIFWSASGVVSGVLYQRGVSQRKSLEKKQKELIERWGVEVTGTVELDEYGFAIHKDVQEGEEQPKYAEVEF